MNFFKKRSHNLHSIAVQPYLRLAIEIIEQRPKKSAFKIKFELGIINDRWLKYCDQYQLQHKKSKWPDREMFTKSIKMYFVDNEIYEKDLNTIFVT